MWSIFWDIGKIIIGLSVRSLNDFKIKEKIDLNI
jgi:hypothetical protein